MERLTKFKAGRMKQLVMKRRSELEEICRMTHIEADPSTAPEKSNALIDSGSQVLLSRLLKFPTELLFLNYDNQLLGLIPVEKQET